MRFKQLQNNKAAFSLFDCEKKVVENPHKVQKKLLGIFLRILFHNSQRSTTFFNATCMSISRVK